MKDEMLLCEVEFWEGFVIERGRNGVYFTSMRCILSVCLLEIKNQIRFPRCVTRDRNLATSHETFALPRADHLSQSHV